METYRSVNDNPSFQAMRYIIKTANTVPASTRLMVKIAMTFAIDRNMNYLQCRQPNMINLREVHMYNDPEVKY